MTERDKQTIEVLSDAAIAFQHLRVLVEQIQRLPGVGDTVFLLTQIAERIARAAENNLLNEYDLLEGPSSEVHHG